MADPLSFAASLIAISTLAGQVTKLTKHAIHASDEKLALEDELEDVKALTKQLEAICKEQWPAEHQGTVDEAQRILDDVIKKRLQSIETFLTKHFSGSTQLKPKHVTWAVVRRKLHTEKESLRGGKERLLNSFHILNSSITRSLHFQAAGISVGIEQLQTSQNNSIHNVIAKFDAHFASIGDMNTATQASLVDIAQLMQSLSVGVEQLNNKLEAGASLQQGSAPANAPTRPASPSSGISDAHWHQAQQVISCVIEGRQSKCALWCTCACHSSQKHLSSPSAIERLTGQLLIGFSVYSWLRARCNVPNCKRSSETRIRLRYKFPAWFLLSYSLTLAQSSDLGINLRFPQVRPCDADVFEMVAHGRLEALRNAFSAKTASIYDSEDTGGHTLLHRALITKNVDVIEFLLQQKADILAVNQKKNSSADIFWRNVLANGLPETAYRRLLPFFQDDKTYIEDGEFTIIHKIIFGQSTADLNTMLTDMPHLVNQRDAYGLSPLHWAATRGDVKSIETLLRHHAAVDILERGGSTPLIWGIDSANTKVTERLLDAKADPNAASYIWLDRAIHIACHEERFNVQIPVLLKFGADASASSRLRDSPLAFAATRDFASTVEILFPHTDPRKHSKAIMAAVKSNSLRSLRKLLELNADCHGVDAAGKTVLHHAAISGSDATLRILAVYKRRMPLQTTDDHGHYPIDHVAKRIERELPRDVLEMLFDVDDNKVTELEEDSGVELSDEDDDTEGDYEDAEEELIHI